MRSTLGQLEQSSPVAALAALPVAARELSLGSYLVVKGFRPAPITSTDMPLAAGQPVG